MGINEDQKIKEYVLDVSFRKKNKMNYKTPSNNTFTDEFTSARLKKKSTTQLKLNRTWKKVSNRFIYPNYRIFVRKRTQQISQWTTL